MKLNIDSLGICRTPVFPLDCRIENVWTELKELIGSSSSTFYDWLNERDTNDINSLSNKAKFTLWKYFNRARYRSTPYGGFASFSLVPIHREFTPVTPLIINSKIESHTFQNWSLLPDVNYTELLGFVRSNGSVYKTGDEIRYIKFEDSLFHLTSIENTSLICDVLDYCTEMQSVESLHFFLASDRSLSVADAKYIVAQLIEEQLLITEMQPNIIGEDYFKRTSLLNMNASNSYIIAERKLLSGKLNLPRQESLKKVIGFLSKNVENEPTEALRRFKNNFRKRFENKTVPLLAALDPEIGIGYGDFSEEAREEQLIDRLQELRKTKQMVSARSYFSELDNYILNSIQSGDLIIDLVDCEVKPKSDDSILPNTFSAIIEVMGDGVYVKSIGGCSATSLSGRFTIASPALQEAMQSLVTLEENANPDVLFFDIGYNGEKKVDNINRRASIYNYELPILNWSMAEHILDINDVFVTLRGDELILYSKKYKKRIVPRLATAYNYTRSDLSLFRFLMDLQHQGLQSNLVYDIQNIFPNLDFYPRVVYESVILTPLRWRVPKSLCNYKNEGSTLQSAVKQMEVWLSDIQIGKYFICKEGDQTLRFCTELKDDREAFLMYVSGKKNVYIEESFPNNGAVTDESGKQYMSEFVLNFWHNENVYHPYTNDFSTQEKYVKDLFLPGDEWLYYEVFCHPIRANELLLSCIQPFIEEHGDVIAKWFFIRYNEPSYHIRLRI